MWTKDYFGFSFYCRFHLRSGHRLILFSWTNPRPHHLFQQNPHVKKITSFIIFSAADLQMHLEKWELYRLLCRFLLHIMGRGFSMEFLRILVQNACKFCTKIHVKFCPLNKPLKPYLKIHKKGRYISVII